MLAQWGQFLLCLALALSCWQALMAWIALVRSRAHAYANAASASLLHFLCVAGAFAVLASLMVSGDYSLPYVVAHTNDSLAPAYRFAATWSAHEGSMLLWLLMLCVSTLISVRGARYMSLRFRSVNLIVLGLINAGITAFILFSSNPLEQSLPPLQQGSDLNPLLQDPGLIFHPPLLYIGYVSIVIVFAATIAGLWCAEINRQWAVWLRPYALFSWIFLSCGIALGSYWAYYELGWGGWWFWDPVENASFMPWLAMTALIHALAVASRSGAFLSWCALLAIVAFALSLLGAFLVRSGVLVSVHSFASDPQRGILILALMFAWLTPAIALFFFKAPLRTRGGEFSWLSAESAVLVNNLLLCTACATVFLGTLYPLALEVVAGERISVGTPYFNAVFVPIMAPLLVLIAIAGLIRWGRDDPGRLWQRIRAPALIWLIAVVVSLALAVTTDPGRISVIAAVSLGLWVLVGTLVSYARRVLSERGKSEPVWLAWTRLRLGVHGMHLAHLGLGVFVTAVALVSTLTLARETVMGVGASERLGSYTFSFDAIEEIPGANYEATVATVTVSSDESLLARLRPERRRYHSQPDNPMTEAAIESVWFGDLFVALTGAVDQERWGVRLHIKPGIYWIWFGVLMMALGGALAMTGQLLARQRGRL